jgi:hypothetical protein
MVPSADDNEMSMQQLAKVLTSIWYNEMASTATLLADSSSVQGGMGSHILGYNNMRSTVTLLTDSSSITWWTGAINDV